LILDTCALWLEVGVSEPPSITGLPDDPASPSSGRLSLAELFIRKRQKERQVNLDATESPLTVRVNVMVQDDGQPCPWLTMNCAEMLNISGGHHENRHDGCVCAADGGA
jgi:hypothetical protein